MALSIKDDETDALVRKLAKARNLSFTAAIRLAVSNELAKEPPRPQKNREQVRAAVRELQKQWAEFPPIDRTEIDDWLYDENGAPR